MKKCIPTSTIFSTISIIIFYLFFAQNIVAKEPIYLHKQNKTVQSSQEYLNQFITAGNIILNFYADWCNPCKRMAPVINTVATQMPQFTFIKINRDFFIDLAQRYNITSIPTLIFLRDGEEIGRYDGGSLSEKKLETILLNTYQ